MASEASHIRVTKPSVACCPFPLVQPAQQPPTVCGRVEPDFPPPDELCPSGTRFVAPQLAANEPHAATSTTIANATIIKCYMVVRTEGVRDARKAAKRSAGGTFHSL
ncbi:hypothetical protein Q1695_006093 [Nippostrongylus brasiliensis]|nr:hypothetical protein Q1695_006093 [Nippostrongylus brasiliensis]